jgi:hypothetical protein
MDSCKQALGGAAYTVGGGSVSITVTTPTGGTGSLGPSAGCPLQQGSCGAAGKGCASFAAPGPGTYTIRQTVTPPGNATNPEGYAPCEGGSACQSEVADVTVAPNGSVTGTVTAVYPDGTVKTWPDNGGPYSGAADDPLVIHDFGLGPGSCDGDGDADDHLTGTPSSHCGFPEAQEGTIACRPYPWSCQLNGYTPGQSGGRQTGSHGSHHTTTSGTRPASGVARRTSTSHTTTRRGTTSTIA